MGGHPSERPTWGAPSFERPDEQPVSHAWPCSGWGLPSRRGHPRRWCALTAPFHPYLCEPGGPPSAVSFLWHCPAGHPDWPLASTLLCGVPTFLDTVTPHRGHLADSPSPPVWHPARAGHSTSVGWTSMSGGANQLFDPEALPVAGRINRRGPDEEAPLPEDSRRRRASPSAWRRGWPRRNAGPGPAAPGPTPRKSPAGSGVRPGAPSGHPSRCPLYWGSLRAGRARPGPGLPAHPPALGPR